MSTRCVKQTRWKKHTERTWHRWDLACPRVKKNRHNTMTQPNMVKTGSFLLEAPRLATRWEEYTEPTWHRWDRVCTRLKKNTHKTFTEPTDMAQIGSCLLEDATFCLQDGWSKQDESSTLKRKQHGTDGIVFARGLRKNTQDFY